MDILNYEPNQSTVEGLNLVLPKIHLHRVVPGRSYVIQLLKFTYELCACL